MIVKRTEFLGFLDALKSGITTGGEMDQMANVQFTGVDMITYNEQIGILVPFEADFAASINHKDLVNIVSKLDAETFVMELSGNELSISTEDTKAGLLTTGTEEIQQSIDEFIEQMPNEENNGEWLLLPENFSNGVELCTPAAEKDLSKGILACLSAFDNKLVCSDNKRISVYEMSGSVDSEFLIRAGLVTNLTKLDLTNFYPSNSWVHFATSDGIIFSVKRVSGDSLTMYAKLFVDFKGISIDLPDGLKEIVGAASSMVADDDTKDMRIYNEGKNLICASSNERGWIERSVKANFSKKEKLDITVSSNYLNWVLDLPDIKMTLGENSSLFESGNFKHIIQHKAGQ